MDVRSRRVRSSHAWMERRSRRSEIYSSGELKDWVVTTRSGVVVFSAVVLILASAFIFGLTFVGFVAAVDFSLGFLGPTIFLVAVTLGCVSASVAGQGEGLGLGGGVVEVLTKWQPRTTKFQPSPGSIC